MLTPFFSVIVPVFNVEEYLPKCIESVLSQTEDLELILVDDGSTDTSGILVDRYAEKNSCIKAIHKPNGGLSDARNEGMKHASGKYVLFLDSDDSLEQKSLKQIKECMRMNPNVDIYYGNIVKIKNGKICGKSQKNGLVSNRIYTGPAAMQIELQRGRKYMAMAPAGIYKREFLEENNLFFKKGILHEDEEWSPRVELCAVSIVYINIDFYLYLLREGSITHSKKKTKNAKDLLETCKSLENVYSQVDNRSLKKLLDCYNSKLYIHAVSVLLREKEFVPFNRYFVRRKWVSFKDMLRFGLFEFSPKLYAYLIDKNFVVQ